VTGVLTAAGDTLFLLLANFIGIWLLLILPTYFLVVLGQATEAQSIIIACGFSLTTCIIFYIRYALGGWRKLQLI
jgi:MATE family multidrug resistance protein